MDVQWDVDFSRYWLSSEVYWRMFYLRYIHEIDWADICYMPYARDESKWTKWLNSILVVVFFQLSYFDILHTTSLRRVYKYLILCMLVLPELLWQI